MNYFYCLFYPWKWCHVSSLTWADGSFFIIFFFITTISVKCKSEAPIININYLRHYQWYLLLMTSMFFVSAPGHQ